MKQFMKYAAAFLLGAAVMYLALWIQVMIEFNEAWSKIYTG